MTICESDPSVARLVVATALRYEILPMNVNQPNESTCMTDELAKRITDRLLRIQDHVVILT